MEIFEQIKKTREYLDYIEEHCQNVQKAWEEIRTKCKDMFFIEDMNFFMNIDNNVKKHDLSKMSEYEFVQYRKAFYPSDNETKYDMSEAWEHHKANNPHHWERLTEEYKKGQHWIVHCVHMIIDWTAMGYKFGDTAKSYYEKNKDKIDIPDDAVKLIYQIFERLENNEKT